MTLARVADGERAHKLHGHAVLAGRRPVVLKDARVLTERLVVQLTPLARLFQKLAGVVALHVGVARQVEAPGCSIFPCFANYTSIKLAFASGTGVGLLKVLPSALAHVHLLAVGDLAQARRVTVVNQLGELWHPRGGARLGRVEGQLAYLTIDGVAHRAFWGIGLRGARCPFAEAEHVLDLALDVRVDAVHLRVAADVVGRRPLAAALVVVVAVLLRVVDISFSIHVVLQPAVGAFLRVGHLHYRADWWSVVGGRYV
eukprot:7380512-Prymnesium_polylepis.4